MTRPVLYVAGGHASGFVAHAIKAEAERTGARVVGKLDLGEARAPSSAERDRQLIALRLSSPKRADAGRVINNQADANHLPLFEAANEPTLI